MSSITGLFYLLIVASFVVVTVSRVNNFSDLRTKWKSSNSKSAYYTYASVCYSDEGNVYVIHDKKCDKDNQIALGRYRNEVNESGWGILEVETYSGKYDDVVSAFAAGIAEGVLTYQQIDYHYKNTIEGMCNGHEDYCEKLNAYLMKNFKWIIQMISGASSSDPYWRQVNLTITQMMGIYFGYIRPGGRIFKPFIQTDINPIYMIQLSGELIDLDKFFNKTDKLNDVEGGRCSGLIKITEGNSDLLFSHVSMSNFNSMNRILKLYKSGLSNIPGNTYSFSGYPGALTSLDDYVLISSGLAVMETTIGIYNTSLYSEEYIKPTKQLHTWLRSIVANRLSRTGSEWVETFAKYNSGTYNNQWIVLDYKLFKPNEDLPSKDVLWILEQIPGQTAIKDVTPVLKKQTYWPSYNIPYIKSIQNISGFAEKGRTQNWYNYKMCPRARIFRRDHFKVKDMDTLQKLMRYNDYTHEEFSKCKCIPPYTAEGSISTRGDLNPKNGSYEVEAMGHRNHGAIDYKGNNYEMFHKLIFNAWGGPTYDPLPVFSWNTTDIDAQHYGQPIVWNFLPIQTKWETKINV